MQDKPTQVIAKSLQPGHPVAFAYAILGSATVYLCVMIPGLFYYQRSWWLIAAHFLDAAIILPMFPYLHKTKRANVALWALCVANVIAIVPLVADGGVAGTGIYMTIGSLMITFILKGTNGLKFWIATALPLFALDFVLFLTHVIPSPYSVPAYVVFLSGEVLAITMLWFYGSLKEGLDRQLAERTKELEAAKSDVEHQVRERTRELRDARAYLVSSINSLEQGFILVDAKGRVQLTNQVAEKLLGIGADSADVVLTDLARQMGWDINVDEVIEKVLIRRRAKLRNVAAGDGRFYQIFVTPVVTDDQLLGASVIIQDVTEQKILDRSKDEFFSIASHELRTPLTAIRGNMSMAKDYYPAVRKDHNLRDLVQDTHDASVRLIDIVNDFLDSSRLEQGKMVFDYSSVDVAALVASVVDDLKVAASDQNNTITIDDLKVLPKVRADEGRFRQILYNLISNANKFANHASIIVSGHSDGKMVTLWVTDTGRGISPENQRLLFHKFQQAGSSLLTRDTTKGTGLGLYISRMIATSMHGSLELEHSEVGKGSAFAVSLPVATIAKAASVTKGHMYI